MYCSFQYSVFSTPDLLEEEDPGVECRRNAAYNLPVSTQVRMCTED